MTRAKGSVLGAEFFNVDRVILEANCRSGCGTMKQRSAHQWRSPSIGPLCCSMLSDRA
jgi:hypothetical protein